MSNQEPVAETHEAEKNGEATVSSTAGESRDMRIASESPAILSSSSNDYRCQNRQTATGVGQFSYSPITIDPNLRQVNGYLPLQTHEIMDSSGFTPVTQNLHYTRYGLQCQHWPIDGNSAYASNFFGITNNTLVNSTAEPLQQYSYSPGTRLYSPHSLNPSPLQVIPRNFRRQALAGDARRSSWTGFYQNRLKKVPHHLYKHQRSPTRDGVEVMKFDAELSELNENLETNITIPHSSDDSGPQAILKYGTMPPTPACSSPPSKQAKVLSMDTLKKLNAGGLIPPPVPSLFVGPSIEEALEQSLYNPNQTTNVYIRGLPPDTTDETLLAICERFGTISSSKAIVDIQTGLCKGFGFAFYNNEDDATACIAGLTHCGYQVSFAKESFSTRLKNLQDPQSTNLYLSNLPLHMHEKDLEDLFQPYKVVSNRILRDSNNMSRGVGFARLADRNSAEAVIDKFDNTCLAGSPDDLPLQVRFADSPNQKRLKGQTQRRRQWRAREYNLLTGHLGLEDLSPTIPGSDISQNCIFAPSSDTSYEHSQYNEDYLSACYRADYSCQAYAQAQFVPHANLEDGAHRLQPAEAIETSMARKLTI